MIEQAVETAPPSHSLTRPTLETARVALQGFYGPHADDTWRTLLFRAGLHGDETDPAALHRLLGTMQVAEPLIQLCGRGVALRLAAYERLVRDQNPSRGTHEQQ
ncbi:hypothetical protein [Actinoplanes sp. NPDC020271]|uniref:hypothetical protein n=1 Tax=Actinoplanes sp. NPDC020271 TaxID=3363896 RepID=UPI00378BF087